MWLRILNNWDTKKGLFSFLISWIPLTLYLFPKFVIFIKENFLNSLRIDYSFFMIISFVGVLVYCSLWKHRRSFGFLTENINIVLALNNVDKSREVDGIIANLESRLNEEIEKYNLTKKVLIYSKPSDLLIESKEKAEKLVQEGYVGSTLIIWGKVYQFKNEIRCLKLHFTYLFAYRKYYKNLPEEFYKKLFSKSIHNSIDSLKWNLSLDFSYAFEEYIINISEIAMFILGRTLRSVKRYEDAKEILKRLYDSINNLNPLEQKKRSRLIISTKEELISLYIIFLRDSYLENNLSDMEKYCGELFAIDKYNYNGNLSAAILEEEKGNRPGAKEFTRIAGENAPRNINTHRFNLAYFALDEGDFPEAIEQYNFLMEYDADFQPILVADYLYKKYDKTKKVEFLFGEGLIKIGWLLEPNDGKKIMKEFLMKSSLNKELEEKYKLLIDKGKELLKRI